MRWRARAGPHDEGPPRAGCKTWTRLAARHVGLPAQLLQPRVEGRLLLRDFTRPERIKLTGALFNALFDLDKFQRFEGRDPKLVKQIENYAQSQWDAFCALEYQRLASEEEETTSLVQGGGGARGWM